MYAAARKLPPRSTLTLASRAVRLRVLRPWSIPSFGFTAGGVMVATERETKVGEIVEVNAERAEQLVAAGYAAWA